jgi:putative toxin-antitoxin system antitoxin component (TIGR02293 family)
MLRAHRRVHVAKRGKIIGHSLGLAGGSAVDLVRQMDKGFPYAAITRFEKSSGLPLGTVARLIQIPPRTLIRRRAKGRLDPVESERLLRIAGVFENALALFEGDVDEARRWLTSPNEDFAGQTPLEFARTDIGAQEVNDMIGRLEHGVFW